MPTLCLSLFSFDPRRKFLRILLPKLWSVPCSISIIWVKEAGWRERVMEGCLCMGWAGKSFRGHLGWDPMARSPPFTDLVEGVTDRTECAKAKVRSSFKYSRNRKKDGVWIHRREQGWRVGTRWGWKKKQETIKVVSPSTWGRIPSLPG